MHLVVIADDITGAFDTGVQFAKRGAKVRVCCIGRPLPEAGDQHWLDATCADVTIIDAETRHLPAAQAGRVTGELTQLALAGGATHLYIKTDSGLRGRVGETISSALVASDSAFLAFVPAYPAMERTTVGGVQYICGVPLQESVFGRDPFEPVTAENISSLFEGCGVAVRLFPAEEAVTLSGAERTVGIFDASCDEDLRRIAAQLKARNLLKITAGCAAFAATLADAFGFDDDSAKQSDTAGPLLVVCGSLNEITARQVDWAVRSGAKRISLDEQKLLEPGWMDSIAGLAWLEKVCAAMDGEHTIIFDTGEAARPEEAAWRLEEGAAPADIGRRIADSLGYLTGKLLREPGTAPYTIMIIGGDTLMGILRNLGRSEVTLMGEPAPGVVRFSVDGCTGRRVMLSKSGSFGGETLLTDLAAFANQMR